MKKNISHRHRAIGHVLVGLFGLIMITLVFGALVTAAILEDDAEALTGAVLSAVR
jgi:hypothetical protein